MDLGIYFVNQKLSIKIILDYVSNDNECLCPQATG